MKKRLMKYALKCGGVISALALMIGVSAGGSACWAWQYQPKEPEKMNKFKKINY